MSINPYIDLFGAGAAGKSAGRTATGIGSIAGLPWNIMLPIVISFFTSLLSGEEDELTKALEMQQNLGTLGLEPPYRSPFLAGLDRTTLQAILNQMGRSANWGWPAGKRMDLSFIEDFLADIPNLATRRKRPLLPPGKIGVSQLRRG